MNYSELKVFLESYSIPTLIISAIIFIITFFTNKFLSDKIPTLVKIYAPFALGIIFNILYDLIFVSGSFNENTLLSGIVCGSLSGVFSSVYSKIKDGKTDPCSPKTLAIENMIENVIEEKSVTATAKKIADAFSGISDNESALKDHIFSILRENALEQISDETLSSITELIITSVSSL